MCCFAWECHQPPDSLPKQLATYQQVIIAAGGCIAFQCQANATLNLDMEVPLAQAAQTCATTIIPSWEYSNMTRRLLKLLELPECSQKAVWASQEQTVPGYSSQRLSAAWETAILYNFWQIESFHHLINDPLTLQHAAQCCAF